MSATGEKFVRSARLRLLAVAVAFLAPVVAAYLLYYGGWRPHSGHPYGELANPVRPVADVELALLEGGTVRFSSFQRRWLLLYFGPGECPPSCARALYTMRQAIAAQGRDAMRLHAAWVVTDSFSVDLLRERLRDYPALTALVGPPAEVARLAREFELPSKGATANLHRVYVVDPLGNFMMSYPANADPSGVRRDLARLLRYSQVG